MYSGKKNIVFIGREKVGKSSLIKAIIGSFGKLAHGELNIKPGITKNLLKFPPIGSVVLTNTSGIAFSVNGVNKSLNRIIKELAVADFVILVLEADKQLYNEEKQLINYLKEVKIPFIAAVNKIEVGISSKLLNELKIYGAIHFEISCKENVGIDSLILKLARELPMTRDKQPEHGLFGENEVVILVIPNSPEEYVKRFVLLQIQTIREVVSSNASVIVTNENELLPLINNLRFPPSLIVGTSQTIKQLINILPAESNITTYSILVAKYKNFLNTFIKGIDRIRLLKDNDKVLIVESCLAHEYDDGADMNIIKNWLLNFTGKNLEITTSTKREFPENLPEFRLVIHCGGCVIANNSYQAKIKEAAMQKVPIVNYGIIIAYMNNIFSRAILPLLDENKNSTHTSFLIGAG